MTKVRQDAWSHEDDVLLADTVLKHIRENSTQLKAFEEVGDILNRTAAACGFRWNAVVRDRYEKQISDAKRARKTYQRRDAVQAVQRTFTPQERSVYTESLNLRTVISFLEELEQKENEGMQISEIHEENQQLQAEVQTWKNKHNDIEKEYQSLLSIINRARRMMFTEDTEADSFLGSSFRMHENGNLEQITKSDSMMDNA